MKPTEKIEELLSTKSFDSLTPEEQAFVIHELGSPSEYEALRKVGAGLSAKVDSPTPNPRILKNLQHLMQEKKPSAFPVFQLKVPAYVSAMLIIFFSSIAWIAAKTTSTETEPLAVVKTDTIFLTQKADTIYREKVVYRYRYAAMKKYFPEEITTRTSPVAEQPVESGSINMKEQEELEALLVSGSK